MAGSTTFVATVGGMVVVAAVALGLLRFAAGTPAEQGFEGLLAAIALASVVAAPGVAALLALVDRPALLLPAGVVLIPLSALSFAGATLPLLIPAIMLFVAYGRRSAAQPVGAGRATLTTVAVLGLLVAATVALFVHQDPRTFSTANGSGGVSNVVSIEESLTSLSLTGAAVSAGWLLAGGAPRSQSTALHPPGRKRLNHQ